MPTAIEWAAFADWGMTASGSKLHAIYQGSALCDWRSMIVGDAEVEKAEASDLCSRCLRLIRRMHRDKILPWPSGPRSCG